MPLGMEQVGERFFGGGEGALGDDKCEKVPWERGKDHLEALVVADAASWGAAPDEAALICRFSGTNPDLPH